MMVAKYIGGESCPDLVQYAEYIVRAVSNPVRGVAFLRVIDESGEDYLYPADQFNIVSGEEQFSEIVNNNTAREIALK